MKHIKLFESYYAVTYGVVMGVYGPEDRQKAIEDIAKTGKTPFWDAMVGKDDRIWRSYVAKPGYKYVIIQNDSYGEGGIYLALVDDLGKIKFASDYRNANLGAYDLAQLQTVIDDYNNLSPEDIEDYQAVKSLRKRVI
jgi:hypothetical protein